MGKAIKVRVSFTDDASNEESLTSAATLEVVASSDTNEPAVVDRPYSREFWSATMSVADIDGTSLGYHSHGDGAGSLDNATATYGVPIVMVSADYFRITIKSLIIDADTISIDWDQVEPSRNVAEKWRQPGQRLYWRATRVARV